MELKIGHLTATVPIIQGGMGIGISLSRLAAAVANEGGIGVIATPGMGLFEPDGYTNYNEAHLRVLRRELRKARSMTRGIIGVNIMVALTNYADLVAASIEEGVDIIFSGAGLALNLPSFLKPGCQTRLVPIVSSARALRIIAAKWKKRFGYVPDAVVVEGPLAGGHLGFSGEQIPDPDYRLEKLIPEVVAEARRLEAECGRPVPVIAAGGVYTGADIYKYLQLGAAGVQMGTRFVTTEECDAADGFKQAYLNAKEEDIIIIKSPVGMPGRAIRNAFTDAVARGEKLPFKCPYHCLITCDVQTSPYCISLALKNAQAGRLDHGFAFTGQNGYRATEITTVKALMTTLKAELDAAMKHSS